MRLIGKTTDGETIVVVPQSLVVWLEQMRSWLGEMIAACAGVAEPPVQPLQLAAGGPAPARIAKPRVKAKDKSLSGNAGRDKKCVICGDAFVDDSRSGTRKLCGKESCRLEQKRRWNRAAAEREKSGKKTRRSAAKNPKQSFDRAILTADPATLTDEQLELRLTAARMAGATDSPARIELLKRANGKG